jgi:hypothetical protein
MLGVARFQYGMTIDILCGCWKLRIHAGETFTLTAATGIRFYTASLPPDQIYKPILEAHPRKE